MTLVDKAQEQIKAMILDKQYDAQGYLPCEGDLCKLFEVSRATIREAVRAMEVRGFVKRVHGKGIKVCDDTVKVIAQSLSDMFEQSEASLNEILEVRTIIEIQSAELAAIRFTKEDQEKLLSAVEKMEASTCQDASYTAADLEFHLCLVKATQNKTLTCIATAYTPLMQELIVASNETARSLESDYHYHRNIYEAIVAGDGNAAIEAMRIHLKSTEENKSNYIKTKEGVQPS